MAASDRGTQMTSKSTQQFFFDLGITQSFSRPKTPTDNAACESWIATLKCERLYEANTADMAPWEVESLVARFIDFYNDERLHQSIDYVTPAEHHDGRHIVIIEARRPNARPTHHPVTRDLSVAVSPVPKTRPGRAPAFSVGFRPAAQALIPTFSRTLHIIATRTRLSPSLETTAFGAGLKLQG